jgi:16S rRNA (guanine966-N2)-methyltransferase
VFNWLAPEIGGSHCLDLFAGTGVLGFEALSRGAAEAVFVERSGEACEALRQSARHLGATSTTIVCGDALDHLRRATPAPMDVVFLDPPFGGQSPEQICSLLDNRNWLARRATVYLEQNAGQPLPPLPAGWTVRREKKAGNVRYSLFDVKRPPAPRDGPEPRTSQD